MIVSVTPVPNERHQQSPKLLIKIPIYEYFITNSTNILIQINDFYPPEMHLISDNQPKT